MTTAIESINGLEATAKSPHVSMYHVTVLSNFARAFDKYSGLYRKSAIPESAYPNEFYVLPRTELRVGIAKASKLRDKLQIPGDELLAIEALLPREKIGPNLRNGLGSVWPHPDLPVSKLHAIGPDGELAAPLELESAMAKSLALCADRFAPYAKLRPRALSFLPVAKGCQASCPFCFSESSVSLEQIQAKLDARDIHRWVEFAYRAGAERAVITGGGEPTLMRWPDLIQLIRSCRSLFEKTVLITNGVRLAAMNDDDGARHLAALQDAGLSVLAISRHHSSERTNARLMRLKTHTPRLLQTFADQKPALTNLKLRLVCVLQRGGVETVEDIDEYVRWAVSLGVGEVCFKELYVSTSYESIYHSRSANAWSAAHQVSLSLVHAWAEASGFDIASRLPWDAPVFNGVINGRSVSVAAYTEPSLFWERSNGIARSWNVMADGKCFASLEDRGSAIDLVTMEEAQCIRAR